jgi:hypothetical protein
MGTGLKDQVSEDTKKNHHHKSGHPGARPEGHQNGTLPFVDGEATEISIPTSSRMTGRHRFLDRGE